MKKKRIKKYEGLGLLEMIIAMGVAGIALVVFMTIAANSMKEAIRYERHDALNRVAVTTALVVRKHVEDAKDPHNPLTFPVLSQNRCYRIDFDAGRVMSAGFVGRNALSDDGSFSREIVYDESRGITDTVYVGYCIRDIDAGVYVGNIVVGYVEEYDGIEEYEHPIVVVVD